jgi:hypothetical protein
VVAAATAQSEVQNQFGIALDGDEAVRIADAVVVGFVRCLVPFLLLNECPNLIALYILHPDVDDYPTHQFFALLASLHKDLHQRIDVQISDALRAAQAVPLNHETQRQYDALLRDIRAFQRRLVGFGVGLAAYRATEAAEAVAVRSEPLAQHITGGALHRGDCCLCVFLCHNGLIICLGVYAVNRKVGLPIIFINISLDR